MTHMLLAAYTFATLIVALIFMSVRRHRHQRKLFPLTQGFSHTIEWCLWCMAGTGMFIMLLMS
jgi:hypothetical protein